MTAVNTSAASQLTRFFGILLCKTIPAMLPLALAIAIPVEVPSQTAMIVLNSAPNATFAIVVLSPNPVRKNAVATVQKGLMLNRFSSPCSASPRRHQRPKKKNEVATVFI